VKHRRSRACHVRSRGSRCARQDGDKGNENGRRGLALTFSSPALSRFVWLMLSLAIPDLDRRSRGRLCVLPSWGCVYVFIEMNTYIYINICVCTVFIKKGIWYSLDSFHTQRVIGDGRGISIICHRRSIRRRPTHDVWYMRFSSTETMHDLSGCLL
jgi:hypothetical protein